jgi:uncharacterized protein (DUF1697 family)
MALVVFLRGVNVGGRRAFRPTLLARELADLGVVSIGAAGTFVVRRAVAPARLRDALARRLPLPATITVCQGRDVQRLVARGHAAGPGVRSDVVRFVSVLSGRPGARPALPVRLPVGGDWLVRILARERRFVLGVYRRRMRTIGCLGAIDRLFGVPATTRSWSTFTAIARVLAMATDRAP